MLSGASDNHPTNVGTAAAVGAQTGYQLSWVALLVAPLLAVVLTIAAHVGAVARNDLQTLTVKRYGRRVGAILLVVSVVAVNVVTIAADLQAGARDPSVSPMSTLMPATNRTVPSGGLSASAAPGGSEREPIVSRRARKSFRSDGPASAPLGLSLPDRRCGALFSGLARGAEGGLSGTRRRADGSAHPLPR